MWKKRRIPVKMVSAANEAHGRWERMAITRRGENAAMPCPERVWNKKLLKRKAHVVHVEGCLPSSDSPKLLPGHPTSTNAEKRRETLLLRWELRRARSGHGNTPQPANKENMFAMWRSSRGAVCSIASCKRLCGAVFSPLRDVSRHVTALHRVHAGVLDAVRCLLRAKNQEIPLDGNLQFVGLHGQPDRSSQA